MVNPKRNNNENLLYSCVMILLITVIASYLMIVYSIKLTVDSQVRTHEALNYMETIGFVRDLKAASYN
ncbi:MAG TPA: hypothetical protein VJL83_05770 [Patescibacteria group bacterium]|nr:hypothetical protein [Patescibacteria group bacterium]